MTALKYVELWKLLEKYRFKVDDHQVVGVTCSICKQIMIDPYNAFCGCQYCLKCISPYLDIKMFCPNTNAECVDNFLVMGQNVLKDFRANVNILNLIVKCPHELCSVNTELSNMYEHVRVCPVRPESCPFEPIGCTNDQHRENNDTIHDESYSDRHSFLVVEAITNLQNNVNALQKDGEERKIEIIKLKQEAINNMETIFSQAECNKMNETMIKEMQLEIAELRKEIHMLRQKYVVTESEKTSSADEWKEKYDLTLSHINRIMDHCSGEIGTMKSRLNKLLPVVDEDYLWTIDKFTEKEGYYYSEPFYKDNHKLRIGAKFGALYLTFYLHVMPGEKDDGAQWPMENDITIGVINQDALRIYEKWICHYDRYAYNKSVFDRQTSDINAGIYVGSISIDDITIVAQGQQMNNSILICCTLMPKSTLNDNKIT